MTLTREEIESLIADRLILISQARQKGDLNLVVRYETELRYLELAINGARRK